MLAWPQGAAAATGAPRFETIGFELRDSPAAEFDGDIEEKFLNDTIKRLPQVRRVRRI
jgi:hypothetical protein